MPGAAASRRAPPDWLRTLLPRGRQVVLGLLAELADDTPAAVLAAHRLAALLEAEEAKYRAVVGDPHANPSLRNHYGIGKVLAFIKVRCAPARSGARRGGGPRSISLARARARHVTRASLGSRIRVQRGWCMTPRVRNRQTPCP